MDNLRKRPMIVAATLLAALAVVPATASAEVAVHADESCYPQGPFATWCFLLVDACVDFGRKCNGYVVDYFVCVMCTFYSEPTEVA